MSFLEEYRKHVEERAKLGIPPLPLNKKQVEELVELLLKGQNDLILDDLRRIARIRHGHHDSGNLHLRKRLPRHMCIGVNAPKNDQGYE